VIEQVLSRGEPDHSHDEHLAAYPEPAVHAREFVSVTTSLNSSLALGVARVDAFGQYVPDNVHESVNTNFITRTSRFRQYFLPLMYGIIPVVGADYFARQLPKFFEHATRIVPAVGDLFGKGSTKSVLYNTQILSINGIVNVQLIVIAIGTAAAMWATWKIAGHELSTVSHHRIALRVVAIALPLACGLVAGILYVIIHAAP